MLSTTSIITSFGGERTTGEPLSFEKKSEPSPALTNADYLRKQCEDLRIPTGPRLHEECEKKVARSVFVDSSQQAYSDAIRAAYQHVYGNGHVMDHERSKSLESELLDGRINIQEFVRGLAKSDFYRTNFYEHCAPERTIELDFKHLLGRTPKNQQEISELISIQAAHGHDAVIDSMIDSAEYLETFGTHTVPYMRSWKSSAGAPQATFNRTASMVLGFAYSDKAIGLNSQLQSSFTPRANYSISFPSSSEIQILSSSANWIGGKPPASFEKLWRGLALVGAAHLAGMLLNIMFQMLGNNSLDAIPAKFLGL